MKAIVPILTACLLSMTLWGCAAAHQSDGGHSLGQKTLVIQMPRDLPYVTFTNSALVGDDLFVCVGEKISSVDKVVDYNIKTKEVKTLFESHYGEAAVQGITANSKWIIWEDADANTDGGTFYILDRNTGRIEELDDCLGTTGDVSIFDPVLSGDFVAWFNEIRGKKTTVQLTNLKAQKTQVAATLAQAGSYHGALTLKDETLLWTDHVDGKGFYHIYQIDTQKTKTIEAPFAYPWSAKLSDGLLFSINFDDYHNWTGQDFGWFDPSDSSYHSYRLTGVDYINRFGIGGDILTVMDDQNRLHFIDLEKDKELEVNNPLKTIDSIDVSQDGRVVAGFRDSENSKATLAIFDFRKK